MSMQELSEHLRCQRLTKMVSPECKFTIDTHHLEEKRKNGGERYLGKYKKWPRLGGYNCSFGYTTKVFSRVACVEVKKGIYFVSVCQGSCDALNVVYSSFTF